MTVIAVLQKRGTPKGAAPIDNFPVGLSAQTVLALRELDAVTRAASSSQLILLGDNC